MRALAGAAGSKAGGKLTAAFESYLRSDIPELGVKALPEAKKQPKK